MGTQNAVSLRLWDKLIGQWATDKFRAAVTPGGIIVGVLGQDGKWKKFDAFEGDATKRFVCYAELPLATKPLGLAQAGGVPPPGADSGPCGSCPSAGGG